MQVAFVQNLSLKQAQGLGDGNLSWNAPAKHWVLTVRLHETVLNQLLKAPHQDLMLQPENKFH